MATLDEIFDAMPAEAVGPTHEELTIDADSRQIIVPEVEEVFGVESDTQAERKYFRCPRYVGDDVDLAACFLRVNFRNANGEVDAYLVEDVAIDGDDITFSWELSRKVTTYQGQIQFSVCAIMGAGLPEWNTTTATGTVLEGLEPDSATVEAETTDVVTQLRATVAAQTAAVEAVGAAQAAKVEEAANRATEAAKDAVEAKGAATLATIPEDYTALENTVDQLTRDRAAAIVCQAEGATIQVTDASNDPLQGLRIFGHSTQDGTPTPDNPVEIVNTPAPVVTVCGKNLVRFTAETLTESGLTVKKLADGGVLFNGTATAAVCFTFDFYTPIYYQGMDLVASLGNAPDEMEMIIGYVRADDTFVEGLAIVKTAEIAFSYPQEARKTRNYILVRNGMTCNDLRVYPMIRPAAASADFEAPTAQTLTITTPGSLPGIPVSSGGNYTDANGQQWIADEVDLARGVYVQRIDRANMQNCSIADYSFLEKTGRGQLIVAPKNPKDPTKYGTICNVAKINYDALGAVDGEYYENPSNIVLVGATGETEEEIKAKYSNFEYLYILQAPVETSLTDVELQAFRALHSNKSTTTVMNDTGAHMVLEYAADPKTYIDNKLAALVAAIT